MFAKVMTLDITQRFSTIKSSAMRPRRRQKETTLDATWMHSYQVITVTRPHGCEQDYV